MGILFLDVLIFPLPLECLKWYLNISTTILQILCEACIIRSVYFKRKFNFLFSNECANFKSVQISRSFTLLNKISNKSTDNQRTVSACCDPH
jgi:hypothetical protein